MKILLLLLATLFLLKAEDPKPPVKKPVSAERMFEIRYTIAESARLNKKYDIEQYHKEFDPIQTEQNNWILAQCKELGIPPDKVQSECRWNLGLDADGKPMNGPDGKPIIPEFWREVPPPSPQAKSEEKK